MSLIILKDGIMVTDRRGFVSSDEEAAATIFEMRKLFVAPKKVLALGVIGDEIIAPDVPLILEVFIDMVKAADELNEGGLDIDEKRASYLRINSRTYVAMTATGAWRTSKEEQRLVTLDEGRPYIYGSGMYAAMPALAKGLSPQQALVHTSRVSPTVSPEFDIITRKELRPFKV